MCPRNHGGKKVIAGCKKVKKKKEEKKNLYRTFSFAVFLFPVIEGRIKLMVLFFSVIGEGKCEINKKKRKFFFLL